MTAKDLEQAPGSEALRTDRPAATASFPRSRAAIDALPYRLHYGHWGLTASVGNPSAPTILASVCFPVGNCGPYDPPHIQDRVFAELDANARAALAAAEGR